MGDENEALSNLTVGGKRLTWQEAAEHYRDQSYRYQQLATVLSDLDRCEHGRHEGDPCTLTGGCGGPSHGNPLADERQVGYSLDARPICIPSGHRLNDPDAWYGRG